MCLKKITLLLIVSIILSFSIRIVGTVFPLIFKSIFVVKATILFNVLFILIHLIFWLVFYREYISKIKDSLKKACMLAILGSLAVSVIYLKKIPFVFDMYVHFPILLMNPYFDAVVPLISSVFHLSFFLFFRKELSHDEETVLSKPISSIIIGISIFIFLHLIVLSNFIATKRFYWLEHMPRSFALGTIPLIIIAVLLMLFFYYSFYRFIDSETPENRIK